MINTKSQILALVLLSGGAGFTLAWLLKPAGAPYEVAPTRDEMAPIPSLVAARPTSSTALRLSESAPIWQFMEGDVITSAKMPEAMAAIIDEDDPIRRSAMFSILLAHLTSENAQAAFEALRQARGGFGHAKGENMRLLLAAWGRIDGEMAVDQLTAIAETDRAANGGRGWDNHGNGSDHEGAEIAYLANAISGWATTDLKAAKAYVDSIEDARRKKAYTDSLVTGLLALSVDDAVAYVNALPADDPDRNQHLTPVVRAILDKGINSAPAWLETLEPDLQSSAIQTIARQYVREDFASAVDWVSGYAGEEFAQGALNKVAESWAETDPAAAVDWALTLPEVSQAGVFREAFDEWAEMDPTAASTYLREMPESAIRDGAVEGFAKELAKEDPQPAADWAATIANDQLRAEALFEVGRQWLKKDPDAARAWIPISGLSAGEQQTLLK
jgi:hypothetical protein